MDTQPGQDMHTAQPAAWRMALAFVILFVLYQLPEGLGQRILHSFPAVVVLVALFLPAAWLLGRWLGFRGLDAWYLGLRPGWALLLAAAFATALLAKAAALTAGADGGVSHIGVAPALTAATVLAAAAELLPYTFLPSIAEDIVTRGFLMRALPALSRRPVFIAASALLYVLNHIYRLQNGPAEWAMLFCFGLAYAAALYFSRSLWPALGLHWGWNFAGQLGDRVAGVDLLEPALGPVVSSLAHLALLGAVVALARRRCPATGATLPV
jgi:membrane protease YdiL (CAAX protease family)